MVKIYGVWSFIKLPGSPMPKGAEDHTIGIPGTHDSPTAHLYLWLSSFTAAESPRVYQPAELQVWRVWDGSEKCPNNPQVLLTVLTMVLCFENHAPPLDSLPNKCLPRPHLGLKSLVFKLAANRKHPLISRSQRPAFPPTAKWAAVLEGSPLRVPEACPGQPQRWGPSPKGRLGSMLAQDRKLQRPQPGADEPSGSYEGPRS